KMKELLRKAATLKATSIRDFIISLLLFQDGRPVIAGIIIITTGLTRNGRGFGWRLLYMRACMYNSRVLFILSMVINRSVEGWVWPDVPKRKRWRPGTAL